MIETRNLKSKVKNIEYGFTLLELLIVFSIIAIISTIGIASFVSYSREQTLNTAIFNIKNFLYTARSNSLNGEKKDCPTSQTLIGYSVLFCCGGASCPTCLGTNDYEMDILCTPDGGVTIDPFLVESEKYPVGLTLSSFTKSEYTFYPLSGGVNNSGSLTFSAFGQNKTISITQNGIIQ